MLQGEEHCVIILCDFCVVLTLPFCLMSHVSQFLINITAEDQLQGVLERVMVSVLTTLPCCVYLFINFTMLFILRSKVVFCETSRYILLYNLLFSDTVMLILCQLLFILGACRKRLTYPVCCALHMLGALTNEIGPLTLALMSLERYVAVCHPLRHVTIITIRTTGLVILASWAISSLNVLIRVVLFLLYPFGELESLQMTALCRAHALFLLPVSDYYDRVYTCFVFVSAGVAIISSYVGVMIAARSASADKASAQKSRHTLLLHLIQLGLILSSTVQGPLITAISKFATRLTVVRAHVLMYLCFFVFPRCLSSLIYGVRDKDIRPMLVYYLRWRMKPHHVRQG